MTVKCARGNKPRSTLRSLIYTPRGNHPCNVLVQYSIVVVSKYKNKASVTPFKYVVLHPMAPFSSENIKAASGGCICKITKSFGNDHPFRLKIYK